MDAAWVGGRQMNEQNRQTLERSGWERDLTDLAGSPGCRPGICWWCLRVRSPPRAPRFCRWEEEEENGIVVWCERWGWWHCRGAAAAAAAAAGNWRGRGAGKGKGKGRTRRRRSGRRTCWVGGWVGGWRWVLPGRPSTHLHVVVRSRWSGVLGVRGEGGREAKASTAQRGGQRNQPTSPGGACVCVHVCVNVGGVDSMMRCLLVCSAISLPRDAAQLFWRKGGRRGRGGVWACWGQHPGGRTATGFGVSTVPATNEGGAHHHAVPSPLPPLSGCTTPSRMSRAMAHRERGKRSRSVS